MKFGRKQPTGQHRTFKLSRYLKASTLPTAPGSYDYTTCPAAVPIVADVFKNDELGDCVVAAGYHIEGVASANAGDAYHATEETIVKDYSAIGNYVPGDPSTDNGCQLSDAMKYWQTHGFANGTKLYGNLAVDPTNEAECASAIWLFENLFLGMGLPDAWVKNEPSESGFTWDTAGSYDANNGHCVAPGGYTTSGAKIMTWGMTGNLTWRALATYAAAKDGGECYVLFTPSMVIKASQKAPTGFDLTQLMSDFDAIGGTLPIPAPAPAPVSGPVTLAQAESWITSGMTSPLYTRGSAVAAANAALAAHWPKS